MLLFVRIADMLIPVPEKEKTAYGGSRRKKVIILYILTILRKGATEGRFFSLHPKNIYRISLECGEIADQKQEKET